MQRIDQTFAPYWLYETGSMPVDYTSDLDETRQVRKVLCFG